MLLTDRHLYPSISGLHQQPPQQPDGGNTLHCQPPVSESEANDIMSVSGNGIADAVTESTKGATDAIRKSSVNRYGHVKGGVNTKVVPQFEGVSEDDELHPTIAKVFVDSNGYGHYLFIFHLLTLIDFPPLFCSCLVIQQHNKRIRRYATVKTRIIHQSL